jgi:O-methyltransferase
MKTVRMTVVMPVGPKCNPRFIDDTLASIEYYAQPGWRLILLDDSRRTGLCRSLRGSADATIIQARAGGVRGGLYLNLSDGFLSALEQPFDILLRIDTDGLVIGGGFEEASASFFRTHPLVGCLGRHDRNYDGTPYDRSWGREQIRRHLTVGWRRTPATSAMLARLVVRATLHGYRPGECVLGGVCIYSRSAIEKLRDHDLLADSRLGRASLEEDHLFGLALRACGMRLSDFGSASDTLPIGGQHSGLGASPSALVEAKKALIHSTRFWNQMDETSIRADFARRRSEEAAEGTTWNSPETPSSVAPRGGSSPVVPPLQRSGDTEISLYLDLLKRCLTRTLVLEQYGEWTPRKWVHRAFAPVEALLSRHRLEIVRRGSTAVDLRRLGLECPAQAETMLSLKRLDNIQRCIVEILSTDVPGDVIETGVWRGGGVIFMRAALRVFGDSTRNVWVADSFQGPPPPKGAELPSDASESSHTVSYPPAPLAEVRTNFERYGLLDEQVQFLPGWFRDTLPSAPMAQLSLLCLDGDTYESTTDALTWLYPKLSPGGFVIIDDYHLETCRLAINDYRSAQGIDDPIQDVDECGAFWQRSE